MPEDFLAKIVKYKKELIEQKKNFFASLKNKVAQEKLTRYCLFRKQISRPGKINLIAEIKKASPSQGLIADDFDVPKLAKIYVDHGAAAISVLTEDKYFLGKPRFVSRVSENFGVPVLTKDFILDEGQIYESFVCGTSAVLLIVAILTDEELSFLMGVAGRLDVDCLVEVHDERELDRAIKAGAQIIGVNNRDLKTFEVDLKVSERLIPRIPREKIVVSESGIKTHADVLKLQELGAHAVLIGETFLRAPDVGAKVDEVMHGR